MSSTRSSKYLLRKELITRRRKLSSAAGDNIAMLLKDHFFSAFPGFAPNAAVAGYYPLESEISPLPLMAALDQAGHPIALPVVQDDTAPLLFRTYKANDPLDVGGFGVREPLEGAKQVTPDIVLVPLLGFDDHGNRIGMGKGYYDRTLRALRASGPVLAIGLAYEGQICKAVPVTGYDAPLDAVITEARSRIIQPGKAKK